MLRRRIPGSISLAPAKNATQVVGPGRLYFRASSLGPFPTMETSWEPTSDEIGRMAAGASVVVRFITHAPVLHGVFVDDINPEGNEEQALVKEQLFKNVCELMHGLPHAERSSAIQKMIINFLSESIEARQLSLAQSFINDLSRTISGFEKNLI